MGEGLPVSETEVYLAVLSTLLRAVAALALGRENPIHRNDGKYDTDESDHEESCGRKTAEIQDNDRIPALQVFARLCDNVPKGEVIGLHTYFPIVENGCRERIGGRFRFAFQPSKGSTHRRCSVVLARMDQNHCRY